MCCYPDARGFAAALAQLTAAALDKAKSGISYRVLFSAHGLPKRTVDRGDPYQIQVERSVTAAVAVLKRPGLDYTICYQSRVGRLEWIGPATEREIERAGQEGKGLVVVPVAFVSEHSETLYELDILYGDLARRSGVPDYIRAPAVRTEPQFISALVAAVNGALSSTGLQNCAGARLCPAGRTCAYGEPAHA